MQRRVCNWFQKGRSIFMQRRDFMKRGTLALTFAATGGWSFDFTPQDDFGNEYNH